MKERKIFVSDGNRFLVFQPAVIYLVVKQQ